ncbi:UvrD-helicase domain-containing protein [bacterium]|nr:UvrD-helicase domain-containing protein [bacterium]
MASLLDKLNPEQRKAAAIIDGPVLIFAGAGSGKTRTLTYRIAHMVEECGIDPGNILAVTFTNKAAGELKERIKGLIGARAKGLWAGTFHSICARILRAEGEAIGIPHNFSIYDDSDQLAIVKEALSLLDGDSDGEEKYSPTEILSRISNAKNELVGVQEYRRTKKGSLDDMAQRVYAHYQRRLAANQALDFDDLLMRAVELLDTKPSVLRRLQDRFDYVLVDEYQDINHAQYRLVQLLGGKRNNICVVGDDDQSIYGWRGANVGIILAFEQDYPQAQVIKLEQNYRSTQKILECAYEVIKQNEARADKRLWTENQPGDDIVIYNAINEEEEAEWVVNMIRAQTQCGNARPGDYAILYRTNAMSRVFEQYLLEAGVPYEIVGGLRFYDRAIIKDALAFLRALNNTADGISLRRIINVPTRGIGDKTVSALDRLAHREEISLEEACRRVHEIEELAPRAVAAVADFMDIMRRLRDLVEHMPLPELVRQTFEQTGLLPHYVNSEKAEDKYKADNLMELVTVAARFTERNEEPTLTGFLEHVALIADIDQAEKMDSQVSLLTLHSAKGLEFPIVFMVGMEEGVFPHERSMGDAFQIEEERRLCYVGITRARRMLYITHARSRMIFGSRRPQRPSRFLEDLPGHCIERRGELNSLLSPQPPADEDDATGRQPGQRQIDIVALINRAKHNGRLLAEREAAEAADAKPAPAAPEPPAERGRRRARPEPNQPIPVKPKKKADGAEKPAAACPYRAGSRIVHKKFGGGVVVSVGEGEDPELVIAFPKQGVKKILASYVAPG